MLLLVYKETTSSEQPRFVPEIYLNTDGLIKNKTIFLAQKNHGEIIAITNVLNKLIHYDTPVTGVSNLPIKALNPPQ